MAGRRGVPFEHGLLVARQVAVERGVEVFPRVADGWLVEEAVDDEGVVPVRLVAAVFVVAGDMVEVAVAAGEKAAAEAACPGKTVSSAGWSTWCDASARR